MFNNIQANICCLIFGHTSKVRNCRHKTKCFIGLELQTSPILNVLILNIEMLLTVNNIYTFTTLSVKMTDNTMVHNHCYGFVV